MRNLISELKIKNPDLKEAEIEGILYILLNYKFLTNSKLIQLTGLPKETLRQFKFSISNFLSEAKNDEIFLSLDGIKVISALNVKSYNWTVLELENKAITKKLASLRKKYVFAPKRGFDQFFATIKTSVSKAIILDKKGLIKSKRIALLGDDDLVSITLALLNPQYLDIVVFDIDIDVLNTVNCISNDLGLKNINTVLYDARDTFDEKYEKLFDVVMTDPPYTLSGVSLFLGRSLELLRPVRTFDSGHIFFCFGSSFKTPEKFLRTQQLINDFGLVIEDKIDKFNRYEGAQSLGSSSSLYILKQTKSSNAVFGNFSDIYTHSIKENIKFPYVEQYVFKLLDVPGKIIESEKLLIEILEDFCIKHGIRVKERFVTKFKPFGHTITFVLENSSLVLHTWPQLRCARLDLVVCSKVFKGNLMLGTLSKLFNTKNKGSSVRLISEV